MSFFDDGVKYLFICLLDIHIASFMKCLLNLFPIFLLNFLSLIYGSLYILDTNFLWVLYVAGVFSRSNLTFHSFLCHWTWDLNVVKFFQYFPSWLKLLSFSYLKKSFRNLSDKDNILYLFLRALSFCSLHLALWYTCS